MNRINQLRNLALAIGLASLCGFGCSSPAGPWDGQQDEELQHSHFVRVDGVRGDNAPRGYAAATGPTTKELSTNLGPSPEPWADDDGNGNGKGPSPEPWRASSIPNDDDGSGGTGTGTGGSGSGGSTSSSSGGNPNPNAAAANNK